MIYVKGNSSEDCKEFSDFTKKYLTSRPKKQSRHANNMKKMGGKICGATGGKCSTKKDYRQKGIPKSDTSHYHEHYNSDQK